MHVPNSTWQPDLADAVRYQGMGLVKDGWSQAVLYDLENAGSRSGRVILLRANGRDLGKLTADWIEKGCCEGEVIDRVEQYASPSALYWLMGLVHSPLLEAPDLISLYCERSMS